MSRQAACSSVHMFAKIWVTLFASNFITFSIFDLNIAKEPAIVEEVGETISDVIKIYRKKTEGMIDE